MANTAVQDISSHYSGLDSQLFTGYPWLNWRDDAIKKNMTIREKRNVRDFSKSYYLAVFQDVVEFFLTCMVGAPIKMKQTIETFPSGAFACNPLYFDKLKWFCRHLEDLKMMFDHPEALLEHVPRK